MSGVIALKLAWNAPILDDDIQPGRAFLLVDIYQIGGWYCAANCNGCPTPFPRDFPPTIVMAFLLIPSMVDAASVLIGCVATHVSFAGKMFQETAARPI